MFRDTIKLRRIKLKIGTYRLTLVSVTFGNRRTVEHNSFMSGLLDMNWFLLPIYYYAILLEVKPTDPQKAGNF